VREPVQQSAGQALCSESFGPCVERQVVGDQRGTTLAALGDLLEQQLGSGLAQGDNSRLIDHEGLVADDLLLQPQQAVFVSRLHPLVDQRRCGGQADRHALLAGNQPKGQGDV